VYLNVEFSKNIVENGIKKIRYGISQNQYIVKIKKYIDKFIEDKII
jgi:hypothetical protein